MDQTTGKFHQALDLLQENTTPLWPDFTPAQPRFFVFDGQATWLHECPPSPDGWQHQAGSLDVSGFGMSVQSSTGVFLGATGSWLWENFSHSVLQSLRPHGWRKCLVEGTQTVPGQLEVQRGAILANVGNLRRLWDGDHAELAENPGQRHLKPTHAVTGCDDPQCRRGDPA